MKGQYVDALKEPTYGSCRPLGSAVLSGRSLTGTVTSDLEPLNDLVLIGKELPLEASTWSTTKLNLKDK